MANLPQLNDYTFYENLYNGGPLDLSKHPKFLRVIIHILDKTYNYQLRTDELLSKVNQYFGVTFPPEFKFNERFNDFLSLAERLGIITKHEQIVYLHKEYRTMFHKSELYRSTSVIKRRRSMLDVVVISHRLRSNTVENLDVDENSAGDILT